MMTIYVKGLVVTPFLEVTQDDDELEREARVSFLSQCEDFQMLGSRFLGSYIEEYKGVFETFYVAEVEFKADIHDESQILDSNLDWEYLD